MKKVLLVLALWIVGMFVMPSSIAMSPSINDDSKEIKNIFSMCIEKGIMPDIEELYKDNPAIDSDRDGLTDVYELKTGTSPFNPDCDNDGIPDGKDKTPIKIINLGLYRRIKAGEVFNIDATKIHPNAFRYYWDLDYKCGGYEDMDNNLSHWFMKAGEHEIKLVAIDKDLTPTIYLLAIYAEPSVKTMDTKTDWDPTVDIKVTVNIKRLKCYDSVDWGTAADMYVKVYIYDTWKKSSVFHKNDNDVSPNWHCEINVPDNQENIPIKIQVWDDDVWWDDKLDIDPTNQGDSKTLELTYSVKSGNWWGEDSIGDSTGYGFSKSTGTSVDAGAWFRCYQNDLDNDGITYWEEFNIYGTSSYIQNKRYAILIARRTANDAPYNEFWNDLKIFYDILIWNGYSDEDIYVCYGNGNDVTSGKYGVESGSSLTKITDYSATTTNIQNVCSIISNKIDSNDILVVWTFDHGNKIGDHSYLCVQNGDIRDDDFAGSTYLGKITNYWRRYVIMGQCFSGGFINDLRNSKTVITTACRKDEYAHVCDDKDTDGDDLNENENGNYRHSEFLFYLHSAFQFITPTGTSVWADSDFNFYVSLEEAYSFATNHDSRRILEGSEHPQLSDQGGIASSSYL